MEHKSTAHRSVKSSYRPSSLHDASFVSLPLSAHSVCLDSEMEVLNVKKYNRELIEQVKCLKDSIGLKIGLNKVLCKVIID